MCARWHKSDVKKIKTQVLYGGEEDLYRTLRHLFPSDHVWLKKKVALCLVRLDGFNELIPSTKIISC